MDTSVSNISPILFSQNLVAASPTRIIDASNPTFNLILSKQIAKAMMEREIRDDIIAQNTTRLDEQRQLLNSV